MGVFKTVQIKPCPLVLASISDQPKTEVQHLFSATFGWRFFSQVFDPHADTRNSRIFHGDFDKHWPLFGQFMDYEKQFLNPNGLIGRVLVYQHLTKTMFE